MTTDGVGSQDENDKGGDDFDPTKKYHKSAGKIYGITSVYSFGAFFFGYGQAVTNIVQNNMLYTYGLWWDPSNTPDHPADGSSAESCINFIT